jgi:hypothetical protein
MRTKSNRRHNFDAVAKNATGTKPYESRDICHVAQHLFFCIFPSIFSLLQQNFEDDGHCYAGGSGRPAATKRLVATAGNREIDIP